MSRVVLFSEKDDSGAPPPQNIEELEELLSRPSEEALRVLGQLDGDVLILGVGGKMGPTLARMAVRASQEIGRPRRVIGVSRFSDDQVRARLESWGVQTLACDLLDEASVGRLPTAPNIVYMTGMKFGASRDPALAWAMNCLAPAHVCRRFRDSRVVAFSSGNVYGLVSADGLGSQETDPLEPLGEYSITVLGRERIFQYFSQSLGIPLVLLRLNYATELRYGVLVDIAVDVLHGRPVDVSMSKVNVIWQGEANAMTLAALAHTASPAAVINLAGPEILPVREIARRCGERLDKPVTFCGTEGPTAYLNDGRAGQRLLGTVRIPAEQMIRWTVDWVARGGPQLGKPTHFQVRDGKF